MQKRKIIIGTYDTALEGQWTLTGWALGRAEAQENYVDVPGHSGQLDLSTALTDGEPYYRNREFVATFESSEGTYLEREQRINTMVNKLDGRRQNIILPDDPTHYLTGRIRVEKIYNDLAHAAVQVTATCDPWRYNASETVVWLQATANEQTAALINTGRCPVVPHLTVSGGSVTIKFTAGASEFTRTLSPGEYTIADIYLKNGSAPLTYSGSGQVTLTYREAVL